MQTIDNYNFKGEKVLIRVDFNVPLNSEYQITDNSRIKATIPSIQKILNDGGSCILMSHLGRPKEGPDEKSSLKHTISEIEKLSSAKVHFASDCIGEEAFILSQNLKAGEILLLENLRFYKEEEKGNIEFANKLSQLGTFYVNDAFGTAHRAHASTAVMAQFFPNKKCFGYVMANELKNAQMVLNSPERPFTAIVGGAKVSDKLLIIENLMTIADHIIIGGGMAYTFFKAQGGRIGKSLCEGDRLELCLSLLKKAEEKGVKIHLPLDSKTADNFSNDASTKFEKNNEITENYMGLDIGPSAIESFSKIIFNSKTILWNGPMGVFEMSNFSVGTKSIAKSIAEATRNGAFSLIGGGDSAAAVNQFGFGSQVSYVSTGGGALLEYFEGKVLPGVAAVLS